jgi:hypothetical protein
MLHEESMRLKRYEIESQQEWLKEVEHIPFFSFPKSWKVRMVPPFGDAVVRFQVKLPSGTRKSVYLDCRSSLGFYGPSLEVPTPYWEVYPVEGDVGRCDRQDTERLLELIAQEESVLSNWMTSVINKISKWFKK